MNGGYILVPMTGLDTASFEEAVNVPGIYNLVEAAIDAQKPICVYGMVNGEYPVSPSFVTAVKSQNGDITISGFNAVVKSDDTVNPPVA